MLSAMQGPRPPLSLEGRVGVIEQPSRARGFSSRPPSDWSCSPGPARRPPARQPLAASEILCSWSLRRSSPPSRVLCCRCGCSGGAQPGEHDGLTDGALRSQDVLCLAARALSQSPSLSLPMGDAQLGAVPSSFSLPGVTWTDMRQLPLGWLVSLCCLARPGAGGRRGGGGGPRGGRRQVTQRHTQRARPHPCRGLCPQTAPGALGTMSDLCSPGWKQKTVNQDLFKLRVQTRVEMDRTLKYLHRLK